MPSTDRPDTLRTQSSTPHYQTFSSTMPPKGRGKPPQDGQTKSTRDRSNSQRSTGSRLSNHNSSPLPKRQLFVLAVIALAEQTAFNSISPYLPDMTSHFPDIADKSEVGLYVGLIASSFALAQFTTNFFWGWLSDRIGRKPVILLGTLLTAACFFAFGFCKTLWQAIVVQVFMGLVNGNQGVVSTCLGEITDRSNQSDAFKYLPVVYGIGAVTGPLLGGLLVNNKPSAGMPLPKFPYLLPNLVATGILLVDLVIAMIFMEESLEEAKSLPPLGKRVGSLFSWLWQFTSASRHPSYARPRSSGTDDAVIIDDNEDDHSDASSSHSLSRFLPNTESAHQLSAKDVLNRDTSLILTTYFIFQLSNIAYNSLYPIFAQGAPPTGRDLSPEEIGVSLGFAGLVTIIFQVGIFGKLKDRIGNKVTYRVGLAGFVIAFILMPWVAYKNTNAEDGLVLGYGKALLWTELGIVLVIKTIAAVGGLTSALLLITNSAPDHSVLGTLNGLAQTLSAAGRAVGPFISGSLFTASTHVRPKGEALPFGLFGGVAFIGFVLSFWIRGQNLEGEEQDEDEESYGTEEEEGASDDETLLDGRRSEQRPLLNGRS